MIYKNNLIKMKKIKKHIFTIISLAVTILALSSCQTQTTDEGGNKVLLPNSNNSTITTVDTYIPEGGGESPDEI